MLKSNTLGWWIAFSIAAGLTSCLSDYARNDINKPKDISEYSNLCSAEFEGENIQKCEDDERFYLTKRIDDLRKDFKTLQGEAAAVNYLQLGTTVGDATQVGESTRIYSIEEVPPQLLAENMSLNEYLQIENFIKAPLLVRGVIMKPLTGDYSQFYIVPENDLSGSVELKEIFENSIKVTEAEFGTSDREKLDFCNSRILRKIPFTANQHPCYGAFLIDVNVDGSDDKTSVIRRLLAYKLQIQDLNTVEQAIIENETKRISSLFNEHLSAKCLNKVRGNDDLKASESLSLRKAKIFSLKCSENLYLSKIMLPSKLFKFSKDRKIAIDKDLGAKLEVQMEASAQNLANCSNGIKTIRSTYDKKDWINFLGQDQAGSADGNSTKSVQILGTNVNVSREDLFKNVVIVKLYRCKT